MILASASRESDIQTVLENLGATGFFPEIVGKQRVPEPKPDPRIFLVAARCLGLDPGECLVFEDAEKGVAAARGAGMPCIVVRTRQNRSVAFDAADLVLPDLFALTRLIRSCATS